METKAPEAPSSYYDWAFSTGKYERGRQFYYEWAVRVIQEQKLEGRGLDVGCGPGGFLHTGLKAGIPLDGLDFSQAAVEQSTARTKGMDTTVHHQSFESFGKWGTYGYFVILETLEHIKEDLAMLQSLPPGSFVIGSVPSVKDKSHVRLFTGGVPEVKARYSPLFTDIHTEALSEKIFGFYGHLKG